MKHLQSLIVIIAAFVSCSQIEPAPEKTETVNSFTVSFATPQPDTKTCLDGNLFKWTSGDQLLVSTTGAVDGSTPAPYNIYATTAHKSESATFTYTSGSVGAPQSGQKYIVMYTGTTDVGTAAFLGKRFDASTGYDYLFASVPSRQTYSPDGLAPYTMPMYAVATSLNNVQMTSLATVLRLKLYGTGSEKIRSIKLESANGYYIAGTYALGKTTATGQADYKQDAYEVFEAGNYYFGMWNEQSTKSNWGSMDVTLDCGEEGVTLSADPTDPTVFNMVIAHKNGAYPRVNVSVQKVGDSNYSDPIEINLPANWKHNKIYTLTRAIDSFTWQTPTKTIACWGDSFTHYHGGQLYTDYLRSLLGGDWTLYDGGVGGDTSYEIMMRQGSIRWKFAQSYSLNSETTVSVDDDIILDNTSGVLPQTEACFRWKPDSVEFRIPRMINPCVINGKQCTVAASERSNVDKKVNITPLEACSNVSGGWITPYGATVTKNADVNIFYIGRNGGWSDYLNLIAQIRTMVNFAGEAKPYIVLGFHEPISKLADYTLGGHKLGCTDSQFQSAMQAEFGDHYLNLNGEIRSRSTELFTLLGMTATADDTSYLNSGNIPRSFYSEDLFHPRPAGYKVIAMLIHDKMVKLGYLQDSYILATGSQL